MSAPDRAKVEGSTRRLRYAEVRLWFDGVDPVTDPPDETVGVVQSSMEETQDFAGAVLQRHWDGECACMRGEIDA